jgi:hypothetical protein
MSEITYAAGRWPAAAVPAGVAVFEPGVPTAVVQEIGERLAPGGVGGVIGALAEAFGTTLVTLPTFGIVLFEGDGVRVLVRGDLDVDLTTETGMETVGNPEVSTWTERFAPRASAVVLRAGGVDGPASDAVRMPIRDGMVLFSELRITVGAAAGRNGASAPPDATSTGDDAATWAVPLDATLDELQTSAPETEPGTAPEPEAAPAPVAAPEAEPVHADADADYDHLWGATVARSVEDAAVRPVSAEETESAAPEEPGMPVVPPAPQGDHDGATISVEQARQLRGDGVRASPPTAPTMTLRAVPRGRIRLSTGRVAILDRPVVIGRRPRSTRASGSELPELIAVDSPQQDISRSHVEIRSEGESVLVVDLNTTNGTTLRRGAQDPVRLHPGEPTVVVTGDVLDLGDGVTVAFEDLP